MLKRYKHLSGYKKGTFNLFQGSLWAQLIGFLGTFVIAKIYGADTIGVFSKFISISSILAVFFTLRLESVFILDSNKNNSNEVFTSIVYSIFISSALFVLITFIFPNNLFEKYNLFKLLVLFSIIGGMLKSLENTLISHLLTIKEFSKLSKGKIWFVLSRYTIQLFLFFFIPSMGLIYGFLAGLVIILVYYKSYSQVKLLALNFKRYLQFLKSNSNLASFGVLSDNLNALNLNIIPIVAGAYFSDEKIGWYFIALALLSVPLTLINNSYSKVFFLRAAEYFNSNQQNLYEFVSRQLLKLSLILIIPFAFLYFLSKPLITLILNDSWNNVGVFVQVLCILFYLRGLYNPISHLEEIFKKNHIGLVFNLYLFVCNLVAIYLGIIHQSFVYTLQLMSILLSIGYISMIAFFLYQSKNSL